MCDLFAFLMQENISSIKFRNQCPFCKSCDVFLEDLVEVKKKPM